MTTGSVTGPGATGTTTTPGSVKLRQAAQRFEAVFLREVIATMRKSRLSDELLGSSATDNFREMADANTADAMARKGSFGIVALVERQLAKGLVTKSGAGS